MWQNLGGKPCVIATVFGVTVTSGEGGEVPGGARHHGGRGEVC